MTYLEFWTDRDFGDEAIRQCAFDPRLVVGPMGQFHCPSCGSMQVAGCPHLSQDYDWDFPSWIEEEDDGS